MTLNSQKSNSEINQTMFRIYMQATNVSNKNKVKNEIEIGVHKNKIGIIKQKIGRRLTLKCF